MATTDVSSTRDIRARNMHLVFDVLRARQAVPRAQIAEATSLSRPTVAAALQLLEAHGIVAPYGQTVGGPGRRASLYALQPRAGLVLGLDIGARFVRASLVDLTGREAARHEVVVKAPTARDVLASVQAVAGWVAEHGGRLRLVAVGFPGVVDPQTARLSAVANIDGFDGTVAVRRLGAVFDAPVIVENDVNLAAIGEQTAGAGAGVQSFAYVKVGTGTGAGLVLDGKLHRGARGAAGEVGFLPVGADPLAEGLRDRGGALETRLAAGGLLDMGRSSQAAAGVPAEGRFADVEAIFDAARDGDEIALAVTRHAAREIAVCIAGITSVVDVELILLGGGIGDHADMLLDDVRRAVAGLVPAAPMIAVAALGARATLVGAASLGRDEAQRRLIATVLAGSADIFPAGA